MRASHPSINVSLVLRNDLQSASHHSNKKMTHAVALFAYPRANDGDLIHNSPTSPGPAEEPSGLMTRATTPGRRTPPLPEDPRFWATGHIVTDVHVSVIPVYRSSDADKNA